MTRRTDKGTVQTELLRQALRRSDISLGEIARRLGWVKVKPDVSRISRTLGYTPSESRGRRYYRETMSEELALEIIEAANLDKSDFDI